MKDKQIGQKKSTHHYATLKKNGLTFEILIVPDKAIDYKKGITSNIRDVLEVEQIYSDARKGEIAADLQDNFGTESVPEIAAEIIKKGHIQLTTEYKKKLQEQKKKEIMNIICTNGIDPRNNLPIPLSRVELAFEQVNYNIDPFKSAEEQVEPVLEVLRPILPISFEEKEISGVVPQKFAGKASGAVRKYGKVVKEDWLTDGSWSFTILIPGGLQDEFMKTLNNITHGDVNITLR